VLVEFVSANPTGPLHIGHGRGAAVGDSLSNLLEYIGYHIDREYYINDVGNQMETLGRSLYLRYREVAGEPVEFPKDAYQGEYLIDLARGIYQKEGGRYLKETPEEAIRTLTLRAGDAILADIRSTLEGVGVHFDSWSGRSDSEQVKESNKASHLGFRMGAGLRLGPRGRG
jgi:arginyl-tRNA synthetase